MLKNPLPAGKRGPYFEGWYFKHQTKTGRALALIPAMHIDSAGRQSDALHRRYSPAGRALYRLYLCGDLPGREYRLATYRGVRIEQWSDTGAVTRQGKYRLTAELLEGQACPLRAPSAGRRDRSIRESLRAKMRYCFWYGDRLLFTHTDDNASFEYADKREEFKG